MLKAKTQLDTVKLDQEKLEDCLERGEDPPSNLFRYIGGAEYSMVDDIGAVTKVGRCGPGFDNTCPTSQGMVISPTHYQPNIPAYSGMTAGVKPWEDLSRKGQLDPLPCGGSMNLSETVIQSALNGNVRLGGKLDLNTLQGLPNAIFAGAIDGFMSWLGCMQGVLFDALRNISTLVIPPTTQPIKFVDGTFSTPFDTIAYIPPGLNLQIDYLGGGASVSLPQGGSFVDRSGATISIAAGYSVQFFTDGTIRIYNGGKQVVGVYQVPLEGVPVLDPNGAIVIPKNTTIPVPDYGGVRHARLALYAARLDGQELDLLQGL